MSVDALSSHAMLIDVSERIQAHPNRISEKRIAELKQLYEVHSARVALLSAQIEPFAYAEAALPNAAFAPWPQR